MTACLVVALALAAAASEPPPELLNRVETIRRVGKQFGPELWPGWDPTATPIAIHKRNELAVLIGHPKPPAPFRAYPTPLVSAPVFVAGTTQGMFLANTAQLFGGVLTSFIGYDDLVEKPGVEEAAALGIHELFHAHLNKIAPKKFGNILVVLWGQYPEFSARNRVLLELEAEALLRALRASDPDGRDRHAADFLGLRAERRKELSPEAARYESGEESSEGLAHYMEYRLLELAYPARADLRDKRLEELNKIGSLTRDRERFYVMGMGEGLLLDRLRPGWKKEFESSDALLDDLLARTVAPVANRRDLSGLVREQEKELAKREEEGSHRLGVLLAKGRRVVVEVGEAKQEVRLRGINPNGAVQLTPNHVAHTFLLLDLKGGWKLEFTGVPVIYDKLQDAFWCMLPEEAVEQGIQKLTEKPEKLVLKGQGFLLELENVEVSARGNEVRVRQTASLVRKPPPPKPEFVKPFL